MKRRTFPILMLSLIAMPVLSLGVLYALDGFHIKELPILGHVPEFSLIERSGKRLEKKDLTGKVWVASFIFTHCGGQCPLISTQLKRMQLDLRHKPEVRFVSFSVDPQRDTPSQLAQYAERFDANPLKWFFVTGEKKTIEEIVQRGFKLAFGEGDDPKEPIIHSFKLALVDPRGRIRGYYDAMDEGSVNRLIKDTRRLVRKVF